MYLLQKIEDFTSICHDARGIIGQYVLEQRDRLKDASIDQVAAACHTSKPTVVRFAKALGFQGWREFHREFLQAVAYDDAHLDDVDINYPFQKGDGIPVITRNLAHVQQQAVEETMRLLDDEILQRAAQRILKARRTVIFTISPNTYLAEIFRRKLMMIGIYVHVAQSEEMGINALRLGEQDCAVMISYSGNRKESEPMRYLPILERKKVPLIGITSAGDNSIRQVSDCVLTMASREHLYAKISSFATEASLMYLLNALYSAVFEHDYDRHLNYKLHESRLLERRRYDGMESGAGYPPAKEEDKQ